MNQYKKYAEKLHGIDETLTGILGGVLNYVKSKSDGLDNYTTYLSSKFFPGKEQISQYDIEERIVIIESALQGYAAIQKEIEADKEIGHDLQRFLVKKIQENMKKTGITKRAAYFEAEKSGYDIIFQGSTFEIKKNPEKIKKIGLLGAYDDKKQEYMKEINDLQTMVYGPRISDVDDERSLVISACNETYQKNKQKLSEKEKDIFESFLKKFEKDIKESPAQSSKKLLARGTLPVETIMKGTEHIKEHFYPNIERKQSIDKGKTGYSAEFPIKTRKYPDKEKDVFDKLLTTIGHEDGGHMVRGDNQEKNGLIIPGAGYEDIEEGITKLNDGLLKYTLDEYPIVPNYMLTAVFIEENYNFEDTYTLLKIFTRLRNPAETVTKEKESVIARTSFNTAQRVKSYYPWDEVGSNRKDVIYFRGEKKMIEYLRSLPNDQERAEFYRKAMMAKVSFEDIFTIDNLLKELGTDKENINHNKLVDKVFNVKLTQGAGAFGKGSKEGGPTNVEKNLLQKDFRFIGTKEYTDGEKKALMDLFTMVGYKKYRGKYVRQERREKLKARDQLKKGNIISFDAGQGKKKAKVISSSLDELKIILQNDGKYTGGEIVSIKKKDIKKLGTVNILNKQKK